MEGCSPLVFLPPVCRMFWMVRKRFAAYCSSSTLSWQSLWSLQLPVKPGGINRLDRNKMRWLCGSHVKGNSDFLFVLCPFTTRQTSVTLLSKHYFAESMLLCHANVATGGRPTQILYLNNAKFTYFLERDTDNANQTVDIGRNAQLSGSGKSENRKPCATMHSICCYRGRRAT